MSVYHACACMRVGMHAVVIVVVVVVYSSSRSSRRRHRRRLLSWLALFVPVCIVSTRPGCQHHLSVRQWLWHFLQVLLLPAAAWYHFPLKVQGIGFLIRGFLCGLYMRVTLRVLGFSVQGSGILVCQQGLLRFLNIKIRVLVATVIIIFPSVTFVTCPNKEPTLRLFRDRCPNSYPRLVFISIYVRSDCVCALHDSTSP